MKVGRYYLLSICLLIGIIATSTTVFSFVAENNQCAGQNTSVVIDTVSRKLYLCENNKPYQEYKVAIGKKGTGKQKKGDNKTPIGTYSLGTPRGSSRFGTFIPVGYPTPEQRSKGFSGNDVGIHGPSRLFAWLGSINTWTNWTQGCAAVGSEAEITSIAQWVKDNKINRVVIR